MWQQYYTDFFVQIFFLINWIGRNIKNSFPIFYPSSLLWRLSYRTETLLYVCFEHNARVTCFNRTVRFTELHRFEKTVTKIKGKVFLWRGFHDRHVVSRAACRHGDKKRAISSLRGRQNVSQSTKAAIQTTMWW